MFRGLALAAAILPAALSGAASAAEFVGAGQTGRLLLSMFGCERRSDFERYIDLIRQEDDEAGSAFLLKRYPSCRDLAEGTVGVVEERTILAPQIACFRPKGQPECLWLPANAVSKP